MVKEKQLREIFADLANEMDFDTSDFDAKANGAELKGVNPHLTHEQQLRDEDTTKLYRQFVESHQEKREFIKQSKRLILYFCIGWVSIFTIVGIVLSLVVVLNGNKSGSDAILLVSALVPMIAAIIGTLNIVTNHVFPEDEDKNITDIVKLIHENDLKNKQENLKQEEHNDHS